MHKMAPCEGHQKSRSVIVEETGRTLDRLILIGSRTGHNFEYIRQRCKG